MCTARHYLEQLLHRGRVAPRRRLGKQAVAVCVSNLHRLQYVLPRLGKQPGQLRVLAIISCL